MATAMHLTQEEVRKYFKDGRRVSFLLERRFVREVLGGQLAPSEGSSFDVLDTDEGKWEVRSLTRSGIYFCPNYMVGSGRSFNVAGFETKLAEIQGYLISDIELFPEIPWWQIPVDSVKGW